MSGESPRKKRHVCLICGSYSSLMINIYEPRCGPNIVDIIQQKFELQLSDDDIPQYLCYSCNNWLINWHSLQNKNEASSSKSPKNMRSNLSIPEEHQQETMAVRLDQFLDVLRLRANLQKYFYYPKETNSICSESAILKPKCSVYSRENGIKVPKQKYRSFRSRLINKKCFRYGHQRKQTVRAYINKSSHFLRIPRTRMKRTSLSYSRRRMAEHRSSQTIVVNPYVVSRLKKLGTTVICEGASATAANDLSRKGPSINNVRDIYGIFEPPSTLRPLFSTTYMYDGHNVLDAASPLSCGRPLRMATNIMKKFDQRVIQSKSNDILIAFNTALQDVFPVDLSVNEDVVVDDYSNIFERIPKSLSITLAT